MKHKILKINNEEWIKKTHYNKLEKSKTKVVYEKQNHNTPTNPENTLAVYNYNQDEAIKKIMGEIKEYFGDINFRKSKIEGEEIPMIIINNTSYDYNYFIQAENIAKAFNIDKSYNIFISNKDNHPVLLDFNIIKIVIAPRINDDVKSVEGVRG